MPNEKILFHGTRGDGGYNGILENGFLTKEQLANLNIQTLDSGWYGKGFYFSSFPEYCLNNLYTQEVNNLRLLIVCFVKTGNIKEINVRMDGQILTNNIDTHYVKVGISGQPATLNDVNKYDEWVVKMTENDSKRILPRFISVVKCVQKALIWRDLKIDNSENSEVLSMLKKKGPFNVYGVKTSELGLELIRRKKNDQLKLYIITNGAENGEQYCWDIRNLGINTPMLVFCRAVEYHRTWANTIGNITVTGSSQEVYQFVENYLLN